MSKILLTHAIYENGMGILRKNDEVVVLDKTMNHDTLEDLKQADGLILRIGKVDRQMIEACPNLKVIARPGVGVDTIDVKAATENGIPVVVAPGANVQSVAEQTLMMALLLAKNFSESFEETKKGNFSIRNKYASVEILGKTIGVIGFGVIGRAVAKICKSVGMEVCIYDPFVTEADVSEFGYGWSGDLHEVLGKADFITLHVPSTPQTRNLLGKKELEAMKKGAFLVNCARGDLVDEDALYEVLKSGHLGGAAEDMMVEEPMNPDHKLFELKNFIVSPHMAALTKESGYRTGEMTAEGVLAVLRGEKYPNVVNKEVYDHPRWK